MNTSGDLADGISSNTYHSSHSPSGRDEGLGDLGLMAKKPDCCHPEATSSRVRRSGPLSNEVTTTKRSCTSSGTASTKAPSDKSLAWNQRKLHHSPASLPPAMRCILGPND